MLMIAHRGASGHAPENTLAAFRRALEMGARAIEFDVHQTRDRQLVVIHDDDLRRVAKRRGHIARLAAEELASVDVGSWLSDDFRGERVPTLAQVYDLCAGKAELHLEVKHGSRVYPGIEERLVDFLRERGALKATLLSSFDHDALFRLRALEPRARLGYLLGLTLTPRAWREMSALNAETLNCGVRQASAGRVAAAHRRGLKVLVYTVNSRKQLNRLAKMGVDGVFTNFPELKPS